MLRSWKAFLPFALIVLFSLFLFRDYFLKRLVPFPANLLVSYYEPWKSYPVPEYPNGPPNKAMGFDNVRIYYPGKSVATEALRHGQPPLWNPYNFSGNVLLGSYQSAVFHPLNWLFPILGRIDAWSIIIMLQPIFAAGSMYVFLRVLETSAFSGLIGALAYAFSGFFMVWWQESYMFTYSSVFLPLTLAAAEQYLKKSKQYWLVLLSLSLALSVLSGAFQMTFYVYAFTALWILYRLWRHPEKWRQARVFVIAIGTSLLLAAIHLIPSMEAYALSTRVSTDVKYIFDAYLLPLSRLVTLFAPDYFGNPATYNYFGGGFYHEQLMWLGAVPLLLILTQLLGWRTGQRHGHFFRIAFLVFLSLTLSIPTTWFILYDLKLPLISTMTPSRIMMLVAFSGAVLAAFGSEQYRQGISKKTAVWVTIILGLALAAAGSVPIALRYLDDKNTTYIISLRNLVVPGASIIASLTVMWATRSRPHLRRIGGIVLILILLGNAYLFAKKYLYFSERRFVYPQLTLFDALKSRSSYDRFWTYENGYIEKNFASQYGVFSPEGYDSIMVRRYAELLAFSNSRGTSLEPDRANALIQSTDHMTDILADPYREKTLRLLGVKYILRKLVPDKNEQIMLPDPKELPRVWEDSTYAIHEFSGALPRVHLFTDLRVLSDDRELLGALYESSTDIRKTVFLEKQPENIYSSESTGSARITRYTPNEVTVKTITDGNMFLFLSDTYYPGWHAYIDNKKTDVFRADYAFRGVEVPQGPHTVRFRYEPDSWKYGVLASAAGIMLCVAMLLWRRGRKR